MDFTPVVVDLTNGKYSKDDLWVHDEFEESSCSCHAILSTFTETPGLPTPIGVFRQVFKPSYNEGMRLRLDRC